MRVLGLDPSLTQFGWAVHDTAETGRARCGARGRFRTSSKTLFIDRYVQMRTNLRSLLQEIGPMRVGLEFPVFNDLWSEGMYGLFLFSCEALRLEGRDVVFFSPGQIKRHAADFLDRPRGWKMKKGDMVEAARTDTGGKGRWNHNEADAYWVARAAARFWQVHDDLLTPEELTEAEAHQFLRIHTYKRGKRAGQTVRKGILHREDERFFLWSGPSGGDTRAPESRA